MKSKPESIVSYLQFVDFTLDAAKMYEVFQDRPRQWQEEAY